MLEIFLKLRIEFLLKHRQISRWRFKTITISEPILDFFNGRSISFESLIIVRTYSRKEKIHVLVTEYLFYLS